MSRQLNRRPPTKNVAKKILIACEGSKTEPIYFESIRNDLRLPTLKIIVLRHQGKTDPLSIIERLIEERKELKDNQQWSKDDNAWAVFDGDEHIEKSPNDWFNAISRAKKQNINLAITNPCFELWYLLHFQDHLAQINRSNIIKLLNKHIKNYDKSICLYPEPLKPLTEKAIQCANKIEKQIEHHELDKYSNPCCSDLPKLISSLLNLAIV